MSLSEQVAQELDRRIFLRDVLLSGLGNITATAKAMKPSIDVALRRKHSVAAIGMALRRYLNEQAPLAAATFPEHIDISTRTGIFEIAVSSTDASRQAFAEIRRTFQARPGQYLSIMEGVYELVLYTNRGNSDRVRKKLHNFRSNSEIEDLACVTVNWPPITKDIPGIYYRITQALASAKVSIQAFHTIGAEMTIFIKEAQLQLASDVLTRLLRNNWNS